MKKKELIICDGMTEQGSILDFWLLVIGLADLWIYSKICLMVYRFRKQKAIKKTDKIKISGRRL